MPYEMFNDEFDDVAFDLDLSEPPQEPLDLARENIGEIEENRTTMLRELRELREWFPVSNH